MRITGIRTFVIDEDVRFAGGLMCLSDRPGLGIGLDEDAAAKHSTQDRWLRRSAGMPTNIRPPDSVRHFHA